MLHTASTLNLFCSLLSMNSTEHIGASFAESAEAKREREKTSKNPYIPMLYSQAKLNPPISMQFTPQTTNSGSPHNVQHFSSMSWYPVLQLL